MPHPVRPHPLTRVRSRLRSRRRPGRPALAVAAVMVAVVAAGCWSPALSGAPTRYEVAVTSGLVYGTGVVDGGAASASLLYDLYLPQGTEQARHPLVVVVHGGGFVGGSRAQVNVVQWSRAFAARGYVVASIDYRLTRDDPVPSARVQPLLDAVLAAGGDAQAVTAVAAIDDTLTALDHLLARPDVAPDRVALVGGSAGAVTVDNVAFALDDYGVERPGIDAVVSNWGGLPFGPGAGLIQNPVPTPGDPYTEPAVFLAHATGDPTVSYQLSVDIAERAEAVGLTHHLFTRNATSHAFDLGAVAYGDGRTVLDAQVDFVTCALYPSQAENPSCTWD